MRRHARIQRTATLNFDQRVGAHLDSDGDDLKGVVVTWSRQEEPCDHRLKLMLW